MKNLLTIVGLPRSGTTWLHNSLAAHSKFRRAAGRIKEVGYFTAIHDFALGYPFRIRHLDSKRDRAARIRSRAAKLELILAKHPHRDDLRREKEQLLDFADNFALGDDWYRRQFAVESDGVWGLDSTPLYFRLSHDGLLHLANVVDRVVCVLLQREPAAFMRSCLQHYFQNSPDEWRTASVADKLSLEDLYGMPADSNVERTLSVIPSTQIRVIFFEDMTRNPEKVLGTLLESIDLELEPPCLANIARPPNPSCHLDFEPDLVCALEERAARAFAASRALFQDIPDDWTAARS